MRADLMTATGGWLLTYLVHSTILLGAAWLLTRHCISAPALRDACWKVALVGGFVTASAQTMLDFEPLAGRLPLHSAALAATPAVEGAGWRGLIADAELPAATAPAPRPAPRGPAAAGAPSPVLQPPSTAEQANQAPGWPGMISVMVALWGGMALLLGSLYLVQRAVALRRLGPRRPVGDAALVGMLEALRRAAGLHRRIRLTAADGLASPVALGTSEIVLPHVALTDLDRGQQRSMLAHELAHLARHDPHWLTFGCLVERVFFFQPLNRIARIRLQEAAEYLCDDWAVRRTGSGDSLATCLVKVAEWVGTSPRPIPLAGMAERPSQLATRVHRLIEGETMPNRSRTLWLSAGAFALVGFTAFAAPGVTAAHLPMLQSDAPASEAQDTGDAALARVMRQARLAEMRAHSDARRAYSAARAEAAGIAMAPMPPMPPSAVSMPSLAPVALRLDRMRGELAAMGGRAEQDTTSIAVPPLMAALKDSDVEVRRAAAQSLANLDDVRAVPAFIEATRDSDAEVRATAAMALGQLEDARGQAALIALLKDSDKHVRYAALSALHSMPGQVPVDAVLAALNDPDADIRQAAIGLAFSQVSDRKEDTPADPRYVTAFTKLLADPSPDVRSQAASALGEMGLTQAPAALLAASKDKNADVRQQVASALARIGDAKAVPVLKEMLADSDADVREQAVSALGEIRDRTALEALVAALKSTDPTVRRNAALALGQRDEEE